MQDKLEKRCYFAKKRKKKSKQRFFAKSWTKIGRELQWFCIIESSKLSVGTIFDLFEFILQNFFIHNDN